jgi:hypothetical protein
VEFSRWDQERGVNRGVKGGWDRMGQSDISRMGGSWDRIRGRIRENQPVVLAQENQGESTSRIKENQNDSNLKILNDNQLPTVPSFETGKVDEDADDNQGEVDEDAADDNDDNQGKVDNDEIGGSAALGGSGGGSTKKLTSANVNDNVDEAISRKKPKRKEYQRVRPPNYHRDYYRTRKQEDPDYGKRKKQKDEIALGGSTEKLTSANVNDNVNEAISRKKPRRKAKYQRPPNYFRDYYKTRKQEDPDYNKRRKQRKKDLAIIREESRSTRKKEAEGEDLDPVESAERKKNILDPVERKKNILDGQLNNELNDDLSTSLLKTEIKTNVVEKSAGAAAVVPNNENLQKPAVPDKGTLKLKMSATIQNMIISSKMSSFSCILRCISALYKSCWKCLLNRFVYFVQEGARTYTKRPDVQYGRKPGPWGKYKKNRKKHSDDRNTK